MIDAYKNATAKTLGMARDRFVYGLEKTRDDKLTEAVGEQGSSPLKIAGKMAGFLTFLSYGIANKSFPPRDGSVPEPPATREEAIAAVTGGFEKMQAAVAGLTEADLEAELVAPWGSSDPVLVWINFASAVTGYWQGQLNLAQLAYGDTDPNIPPSWLPVAK